MNKLILLSLLSLFMYSCDNSPTKVEDPKKVTTIELQELANQDTVLYKLVIVKDTHYLLDTNNQVKYKVEANDGLIKGLAIFITLLVGLIFIILIGILD